MSLQAGVGQARFQLLHPQHCLSNGNMEQLISKKAEENLDFLVEALMHSFSVDSGFNAGCFSKYLPSLDQNSGPTNDFSQTDGGGSVVVSSPYTHFLSTVKRLGNSHDMTQC